MPRADASNRSETASARPALVSTPSPWTWIPTVYLAEGLPNVIVATVSVVVYKNLAVSNADIAFYTSWLYLPWVIKPLWSPVVDMVRTRRLWIWTMQLLLGLGCAGVALALPSRSFFVGTLAGFAAIAFVSATHDIAADGFYLLALSADRQAWFVGVRNSFFRIAMICGQGGLVALAGRWAHSAGSSAAAWSETFALVAALFLCFSMYHAWILPRPPADQPGVRIPGRSFIGDCTATVESFFRKPGLAASLLFLLFYRFGEAQLVKLVPPFLLDARSAGGLGLTNEELGLVYGTIGVVSLLLGGLAGGWLASRQGLRFWLWPMAFAIHLPDTAFVYLAWAQPHHLAVTGICIAVEQFGYGFGFTAYMLYMMYVARGEHQTAHYAICTGFMALGLMLPSMWSGWLQQRLGYPGFFVWVLFATLPGFAVTALASKELKRSTAESFSR